MIAMQLTRWFPWHVKPVYTGVYIVERRDGFKGIRIYSYWDGSTWNDTSNSREGAWLHRYYYPSTEQRRAWRGLEYVGE